MKERLFETILNNRKKVIVLYLIAIIACAVMSRFVVVNTDIAAYLPEDSMSTVAIELMEEEFDGGVANTHMMVSDISYNDACKLEAKIAEAAGVSSVSGPGSANILGMPYEMISKDTISSNYKDNTALYSIIVDDNCTSQVLDELRNLAKGHQVAFAGNFVNAKVAQAKSGQEVTTTIGIVVIIGILIMMLTLDTYAEPFILVLGLFAAVVLNMGTNLMFGTISYVTKTAASVLQMGVSVDYSVFLLHRYKEKRAAGLEAQPAMVSAMSESATSILSSSVTTIIGFVALIFMHYRIGMDMGIVMSKGILISLICVFTLLPCIIVQLDKLINKTRHRPIITTAGGLARIVMKIRIPAAIVFVLLLIPAVGLQLNADYYYGTSHLYKDTHQVMVDRRAIEDKFGENNLVAVLLPADDKVAQIEYIDKLKEFDQVESVKSLSEYVGASVPGTIVPDSIGSLLESENYSRIVLTLNCEEESSATFAFVEELYALTDECFDGKARIAGTCISTYDLKNVISVDNIRVNLIAIIAILLTLVVVFRSMLIPVILTLCIEGSIWLSMSMSPLMNVPLYYIGYLIVSSILLGATVDYAILLTSRYREFKLQRVENPMRQSISVCAISIFTSGLILISAGVLLKLICVNQLTAQLGLLLARGVVVAIIAVLMALPAFLGLLEKVKTNERTI